MTDQGRLARARRLKVEMELSNPLGGWFQQFAILDTGAPFSVVPFTVWNTEHLSWAPLGSQFLTLQGQPDPEALKWLGVPCDFGEVSVALLDETQRHSRSLRLIAKFPRSATPSHLESHVLLGCSFLADNSLTVTLHPRIACDCRQPRQCGWLPHPPLMPSTRPQRLLPCAPITKITPGDFRGFQGR